MLLTAPTDTHGIAHSLNYLSNADVNTRRKVARKGQLQERRLSIAETMNIKLAFDIRDYLATHAMPNQPFNLPQVRADYKLKRDELWTDRETGEILIDRELHYLPLIRTYYALFSNYHKGSKRTLGTAYINDDGAIATAPKLIAISRHKLNHVWNFYKSQIIRRKYLGVLQEWDALGILRQYTPVHITLTVPRGQDGLFQGERFFGHKLLYWFNLMRKEKWWKEMVFAGECGLETKKGKTTAGYHIHVHSFSLLNAEYTVHQLRKKIQEYWLKHTGGKLIGCETLYITQRHPNGKPVYEYVARPAKNVTLRYTVAEYKERKKEFEANGLKLKKELVKRYIDADSSLTDYLQGVMECIKYHFKPDMFLDTIKLADKSTVKKHDVSAILEVLHHTHNKRLYSKFGAFYKIKELALSFKEDAESEVLDLSHLNDDSYWQTEEGKAVAPSAAIFFDGWEERQLIGAYEAEQRDKYLDTTALGGSMPRIDVNPFTLAEGEQADGIPVLYNVNQRRHAGKDYYKHFEVSPFVDTDISQFIFLKKDAPINDIIKLMALGKADEGTLKNRGYIDESMTKLKQDLSVLITKTAKYFTNGPGLAQEARAYCMEQINTGGEFHIYSPDILALIKKAKEKVAQLQETRSKNQLAKPMTDGQLAYWEAWDKAGQDPEERRINLESRTHAANEYKRNNPLTSNKVIAARFGVTEASIVMHGTGLDLKRNLNLQGRLAMQIEGIQHYLRTKGYTIEKSPSGHITNVFIEG
jgi:hypothetical protein